VQVNQVITAFEERKNDIGVDTKRTKRDDFDVKGRNQAE